MTRARIELRPSGWVVVVEDGAMITVIGRHAAKYKARQQADAWNADAPTTSDHTPLQSEQP
jgi:hypothetical protein